MARTSGSETSDFILAQPADMSPKEVVEKGKEAGLTFTTNWVYRVRQRSRNAAGGKAKRGRATKGTSTAKAATPKKGRGRRGKKAADQTTEAAPTEASPEPKKRGRRGRPSVAITTASAEHPTTNKADFIRSFDSGTSAKEIVAAGRKAGLKFSVAYVYTARSNAPTKQGRGEDTTLAATPRKSRGAAGTRTAGAGDQDLVTVLDLVLRLGLPRVQELLGEVRRRVETIAFGE